VVQVAVVEMPANPEAQVIRLSFHHLKETMAVLVVLIRLLMLVVAVAVQGLLDKAHQILVPLETEAMVLPQQSLDRLLLTQVAVVVVVTPREAQVAQAVVVMEIVAQLLVMLEPLIRVVVLAAVVILGLQAHLVLAAQESSFLNTRQNPIIKSSNPRVHGLHLLV
jgi:hypothetical protein